MTVFQYLHLPFIYRIGQLLEYFAENDSVREQDNTG